MILVRDSRVRRCVHHISVYGNINYLEDMKVVKNRFIPPRGFAYVNLFGVLFTRRDRLISSVELNHEQIHTEQMKEMLYVFFYLCYLIEWLIRLIILRDSHKAYRAISFEQEDYANQANLTYLECRKRYRWLSYLF